MSSSTSVGLVHWDFTPFPELRNTSNDIPEPEMRATSLMKTVKPPIKDTPEEAKIPNQTEVFVYTHSIENHL